MKLTRRLFFRQAAGAAAAGPLAVQAVARDVEARGLAMPSALDLSGLSGPDTAHARAKELEWIKDSLSRFLKNGKPRPRPEYVQRFDGDLVANRSMSLSTRIRIQAERDAIRSYEREHQSFLDRIAYLSGGGER